VAQRDGGRGRGWGRRTGVLAFGGARAVLAVVLVLPGLACAAEKAVGAGPEVRRLAGQELAEAQAVRDRADRLRDGYEKANPSRPGGMPADNAEDLFKAAVAAYREAADKYPGTDIGAYCLVRLSGLYQYRKDYASATAVLDDLATRYAGTEAASEAFFSMGLMQLQALHDPAAAAPWFEKVSPPPTADEQGVVSDRKYSRADVRYVSAQQQLAKCEIRLGKLDGAVRRVEALGKRYPQYQSSFVSALRFEVKSALSDPSCAAFKPALSAWLEKNP